MNYNPTLINEVKKLDSDLREIYQEFGTSNIYLKKLISIGKKDIYGYTDDEDVVYSEPYPMIGRVQLANDPETQTGLGENRYDRGIYTFFVIASVLKDYGIDTITTDDKIFYNGNDLDIVLVTPTNMLGDFALQYKLVAYGDEVIPPHFE